MEIKDNEFSRQFETTVNGQKLTLEYSHQERKLFLTKVNIPDGFEDADTVTSFIKEILDIAEDKNLRIVPVHPKVAAFIRKNPGYKSLLPPGIKL